MRLVVAALGQHTTFLRAERLVARQISLGLGRRHGMQWAQVAVPVVGRHLIRGQVIQSHAQELTQPASGAACGKTLDDGQRSFREMK